MHHKPLKSEFTVEHASSRESACLGGSISTDPQESSFRLSTNPLCRTEGNAKVLIIECVFY